MPSSSVSSEVRWFALDQFTWSYYQTLLVGRLFKSPFHKQFEIYVKKTLFDMYFVLGFIWKMDKQYKIDRI